MSTCLLSGTHNYADVTRYSAHIPPKMFESVASQATRRPLRSTGIGMAGLITSFASHRVLVHTVPRVPGIDSKCKIISEIVLHRVDQKPGLEVNFLTSA